MRKFVNFSGNNVMILVNYALISSFILFSNTGLSQIIESQVFSSTTPSSTWGNYTSDSGWDLTNNYGTGNAHSGTYCAKISSGNNNKFVYIPINVSCGNSYSLSFWEKRICGIQVYINDAADQLTPLYSYTSSPSCDGNWHQVNCTSWTATISGIVYFQIAYTSTYGGSPSMYIDDITVSETIGTPCCTVPTNAPSSLSITNLNSTNLTLNWVNGNGDKTLVVAGLSAMTNYPANGTNYNANYQFGFGEVLDNGYVVYNGSSNSAYISNLDRNTNYTFTVFTYNSIDNCYNLAFTSTSQTTANDPIAFYVDDNSNLNDVYTIGSASGSDAANGKRLTPFASLTKAFTVVQAGDTIYVDAGTYSDADNKDLTLPTTGLKILGAGYKKTIFDNGSNSDHYFMRIYQNNTLLSDMTIKSYAAQTCGANEDGQALGIIGATGVNIINVVVDKTATSSDGCGYPIEIRGGASVIFQGGGATCNNYLAGGGMRITGATSSLSIINYLFYGNEKHTDNGASLHVTAGNVNVQNTEFKNNSSRSSKRGAGIYQSGGILTVKDCVFDQNETWLEVDQVGGTILVSGGNCSIKKSIISNHTQAGGSTSYGAGVGVTGGTVYIDSCLFNGNDGDLGYGTDVHVSGGNVYIRNSSLSSLSNRLGSTGGTTTINNSGSFTPTYSAGMTFLNTLDTSYTANPNVPQYIGDCPASITFLPVELSSFSGKCLDGMGALSWTTDSEHNNAYFTLERAVEENDFELIAFENGMINTTERTEYHYLDTDMSKGTNYYRLSQTDLDGQKRILKTIAIENDCYGSGLEETAFVVDALLGEVTLLINVDRKVQFEFAVYDNMGRLMLSEYLIADPHQQKMTLLLPNSMAAGVYHLSVTDGSTTINKKVFMNK